MATNRPERQNIHVVLTLLIQALVVVGLILFLIRHDWEIPSRFFCKSA